MAATPRPVTAPPAGSAQGRYFHRVTIVSPHQTTTIAMTALASVSGTLYRICAASIENPSMATKCMTQMPVPPMETAAAISQPWGCATERARRAHCRPSNEPMTDMT
ncbi:hypothetical protein NRB56_72590 [Nocardia sp. RB56]|uniref:Uncharacterized protein n=1 Tax=Nocardia aurantia TaxID=2585199 RepID=A0A7K0E0N4_9NOCA|nr:hypothetical protein [Nocardia aurantia]